MTAKRHANPRASAIQRPGPMKEPGEPSTNLVVCRRVEPLGELDRALLDLLDRLPLTWESLDHDKLTAAEQEALKLLTTGGLVERRLAFSLRLIGHAVSVEATVTATGEYGIVEALEPVAKAAWQAWAGDYLKGKAGAPQDQPAFHCERVGPEQARLTQEGQQAKADVDSGQTRMVLDFLHKRTVVFAGRVVRGHGRAEKVSSRTAPAEPVRVEMVNSGPMAAIAETMQKWFEAQTKAQANGRPDDLITTEIAVRDYCACESTIRRKVKAGQLHDYRPANSPKNSKLLLSRAELARHFALRE